MITDKDKKSKPDWVGAAMRHTAFESLEELARIAAAFYRGAKREGLSADEAKDVTEATLTALFRNAAEASASGSPKGE